jgi:hypothetical protein
VLNFTGCPRLTIAATSIGAVKHEVYDDKRKTGKDAGELRVVPGHDRYVEASPKHAGVSNLSCEHRRNTSRNDPSEGAKTRAALNRRQPFGALAAITGPQPKPTIVRVNAREHTTRLPRP